MVSKEFKNKILVGVGLYRLIFVAISVLLVLVSTVAQAKKADPKNNDEFKIQVDASSPDYPIEQLKESRYQNVKKQKLTQNYSEKSYILPPDKSDKIFLQLGLTEYLKSWDQLSKDLLIIRSQTMPEERFFKTYKSLPTDKLKQLKDIIKNLP